MSVQDELAKDQRVQGKGDCKACDWIGTQPNADEWDRAIAKPTSTYSTASVLRLAQKKGAAFSLAALKRHRLAGHRA